MAENLENKLQKVIDKEMNVITFKEFMQELLGAKFEEVYDKELKSEQ